MEPKDSVPCSQQPATTPYLEPNESISNMRILFFKTPLNIISIYALDLQVVSFFLVFQLEPCMTWFLDTGKYLVILHSVTLENNATYQLIVYPPMLIYEVKRYILKDRTQNLYYNIVIMLIKK